MTTETLFEKMRTRECLDCGVVGFAGPPTAEHCHKCVLEHLSAKATAIYGGGEVLATLQCSRRYSCREMEGSRQLRRVVKLSRRCRDPRRCKIRTPFPQLEKLPTSRHRNRRQHHDARYDEAHRQFLREGDE